MTKQGAKTVMPRLRFPEFRQAGSWRETKLGVIAESESSSLALNKVALEPQGFPLFGADGLVGRIAFFEQPDGYIGIVKDGSGVGRLTLLPAKSSVLGTLAYVKPALGAPVSLDWLFHCMASLNLKKYVKGSGIPHIYFADYSNEPIGLPAPAEQQKIADCLTSLDEVIAAQGRKVDALKAHKRGLMQQLFPREAETRPRLRFPEFRDAPEWKQEALGETTDVLMCKRIFASETNTVAGVPFYKIGTLGASPDAYISKELFEDYKARYSFPRVGEILITCSGTVGKCLRYDGGDAYFQDSNIVWVDNPAGAIINDLLFALISNVDWSKLNSTTITRIYGPDLRGLPIKYPKDAAEQQRIADCLASLDTRITAETARLAALKTHKQGLMQQLFPAPEAMNA